MGRRPHPQSFPKRAFSVAEAREHGVSPKRLRARDLTTPFRGVRALATPADDAEAPGSMHAVAERCRLFEPRRASDAVYSHFTAALLFGIPLPLAHELDPTIHLCVPAGHRAAHANGCAGHSVRLGPHDRDSRLGLPVTSAARTWCDLGALLDFDSLVAAGDHVLRRQAPLACLDDVQRAVAAYPGRRGLVNLRSALPLLSERAESPQESRLRMAIHRAGLPAPEVNFEVHDRSGLFLGRVDLAYPRERIALEYEGDHHRTDKNQWRRDITRLRAISAVDWRVDRFTDDDITSPRPFLAELARALHERRPR